ncbi:T9SS type A sorting domain-containing protein [Flavobacterium sp. DGU11]|uniref:T9SS type A sorting domain-containing protein n=1 Tax=Flavobacterium arundinis TaxID=3139143 RepID=A0ABU9HYV1_9FLAO
MKFITPMVSAVIAFVLLPLTASAQSINGFENQKGFEVSQKSGVLSKLSKWQKHLPKHKMTNTPQERMLSQLGIRPGTAASTLDTDYDFYGGLAAKGNNIPLASVTDAEGNTYITGGSSNEDYAGGNYFTIKVGPAGTVLWETREEAPQYAVETGMALVLDTDGNLIATGIHWNGDDMDIKTIKYNPETGTKLWTSIYDGPGEGVDIPSAMVVDADGNIFVTGISYSGISVDYITLKYTADGSEAWNVREDGPGDGSWNEATAIALDGTGNVIVTGYSPNVDGWLNYHTVKYSPAGAPLWTQAYNYENTDPNNPAAFTNSVPHAVTTDAAGNVYVAGVFDTFFGFAGTIKYDANGVQQWVDTYVSGTENTQAFAIAMHDNKLYVAGTHNGSFADDGNILISYNPDGTQNWVQESTDLIEAGNTQLLFDGDGNIVVAAKGMTPGAEEWEQNVAARAKKYSTEGTLLGEAAFVIVTTEGTASMGDIAGAGLDADGNVYMVVNSYYSAQGAVIETVKSGFGVTAPEPDWNEVYTNLGSPSATMLYSFPDNNNGTISTGQYYVFADTMLVANYFLVKHNADGTIAWEKVFNADNSNAANGIIARADADGNLFVCLMPDFDQTALTIKKFSPAGNELWETEVELTNAAVYVMETGQDGSLYLGGTAFENDADEHASFVAVKLNAAGAIQWTTYTGTDTDTDNIYQVNSGKVNAAGELILTGHSGSGDFMSQEVNATVVKFNANGSAGWVAEVPFDGSNSSAADLLLDSSGAVYLNGFSQNGDTFLTNIITAKVSAEGTVLWSHEYDEADRNERSYTIKQFSDGAIAVIGYSIAPLAGDIHNVLLKYDADGNELWNFSSEDMRYYNDFHIDGSDNCFIMDQEIIDPFPHKIYTAPFPIATLITVDAEGNGDEQFFVGPEYAEFYGENLIPHPDNRLLLGGSVGNQVFYEGLYFFETEHDGSLGVDGHEIVKDGNSLGQNYPNPATGITQIPLYLINGGKVSIKLYNNQGRLVKEIANDTFASGKNTIEFDASGLSEGIYYYQITAGTFKQARKMVVGRK